MLIGYLYFTLSRVIHKRGPRRSRVRMNDSPTATILLQLPPSLRISIIDASNQQLTTTRIAQHKLHFYSVDSYHPDF